VGNFWQDEEKFVSKESLVGVNLLLSQSVCHSASRYSDYIAGRAILCSNSGRIDFLKIFRSNLWLTQPPMQWEIGHHSADRERPEHKMSPFKWPLLPRWRKNGATRAHFCMSSRCRRGQFYYFICCFYMKINTSLKFVPYRLGHFNLFTFYHKCGPLTTHDMQNGRFLCFKVSPCPVCNMFSFG